MTLETKVTTTTVYNIQVTGEELIKLICNAYGIANKKVEYNAVVYVPGGGDWSNTSLSLDEHPIRIEIISKEPF